jgi:putative ABC transport system permease protein
MEINLFGMDRYRIRQVTDNGMSWIATPEVSRFYTTALERIQSLPGVESVANTSNLPPRRGMMLPFQIIGKPAATGEDGPATAFHEISPAFFQTLRVPLVRGRAFNDLDIENAPGVAIVNEEFAREYFGNEDAIGKSVLVDMNSQNRTLDADRLREIVGVVGNVKMTFQSDFTPTIYVPYRQSLSAYVSNFHLGIHATHDFVVRTSGNAAELVPMLRRAFAETDGNVAVANIMPMEQRLATLAGAQEFWMRLLGIFAGLGMFLAAIGIYGVISYTVEQRTHEFGIRTTLGARNVDILRLVLREGILVIVVGLALGIAGTYAATRLIESQLYGVTAMDPLTIVAVGLVLSAVALLACYIPSRRATRIDPLTALRAE